MTRAGIVVFFAVAVATAVMVGTSTASAHRFGVDSVTGREIRYEDHTRYDDARNFGAREWNKLGSVAIRQSTSGADLEFRDYNHKMGT